MNEPSQDLVIVPQISLEKVWNRVLEVDQGGDRLNAVGLGLRGVVDFDLKITKIKILGIQNLER